VNAPTVEPPAASRGRAWRHLAGAPLVLLLGILVALGPVPAEADQWTLTSGIHLDAWSANQSSGQGDGFEVLVPIGIAYDTPTWGLSARGSFGTTQHDLDAAPSASISGFTDTTLTGYYRWRISGAEVRFGLDLDLPTGVSRLKTRDLPAIQDEDLVALQRFGEGFDVNPTVIVYRSFGDWGIGGGVGYLFAGEYDPTQDIANDDFNPGDELSVNVLGDVFLGDVWRLMGRVAYTHFTRDERGGVEVFREGDELDIGVGLEWRPEPWWAVASVRNIYRFKAERVNASGQLDEEPENSRGNEIRGAVTVGYIIDDVWTVRGTVDFRYVAANDYATNAALYDGGRFKIAVGPGVTWTFSRTFALDASVRWFYLDAERSPIFPLGANINGVHADMRVVYRF
jgi:hypothetical protein